MSNHAPKRPDYSGFAFISTMLDLRNVPAFEVLQGYSLQRANAEQTAKIRESLSRLNPFFGFSSSELLYESDPVEIEGPPNTHTEYRRLREEDWRYSVLTFSPNNHCVDEIECASNLT